MTWTNETQALQDDAHLAACRRTLEQAAPGLVADVTRTAVRWPRLQLKDARSVQYAFLLPIDPMATELHVFPGDTLGQARVLFGTKDRPDGLLRLRERGWEMRPNFHFGARVSGHAWQTATAPVDRYVDWCLAYVPYARVLEPHQWDRLLDELDRRGFASPGDKEKFYAAFKGRKTATPRPGLHLRKAMRAPLDEPDDLVREVRLELAQILRALYEPLGPFG